VSHLKIKALESNNCNIIVVDGSKRTVLGPDEEVLVSRDATIESEFSGDAVAVSYES